MGKDLDFHVSNKQVGIVGAHLRTHGNPSELSVELFLKCEAVETKDKLS